MGSGGECRGTGSKGEYLSDEFRAHDPIRGILLSGVMVTRHLGITIARPFEQVYGFLKEAGNVPKWASGKDEFERDAACVALDLRALKQLLEK